LEHRPNAIVRQRILRDELHLLQGSADLEKSRTKVFSHLWVRELADGQRPEPFHIFQWLESLEILSRFQSPGAVSQGADAWLWKQRTPDGLWNFGARVSRSTYFPLSDDWRREGNRSVDHSTRVLACIAAYDPGL
jgi:hypothetical protein